MILPKIVYGTGPTTLNFTYPPVNKPGADDREAHRNDSVSLSGILQTVWWRTDRFINLQMDFVVQGTDLQNWEAFQDFGLTGAQFEYYPDATVSGTHYTCTLDGNKFLPTLNFKRVAKFTLRLRKA